MHFASSLVSFFQRAATVDNFVKWVLEGNRAQLYIQSLLLHYVTMFSGLLVPGTNLTRAATHTRTCTHAVCRVSYSRLMSLAVSWIAVV